MIILYIKVVREGESSVCACVRVAYTKYICDGGIKSEICQLTNSLARFRSLPVYIRWVKYISWLLHSSEALSILQWNGVHNICKFHFANIYTEHVVLVAALIFTFMDVHM